MLRSGRSFLRRPFSLPQLPITFPGSCHLFDAPVAAPHMFRFLFCSIFSGFSSVGFLRGLNVYRLLPIVDRVLPRRSITNAPPPFGFLPGNGRRTHTHTRTRTCRICICICRASQRSQSPGRERRLVQDRREEIPVFRCTVDEQRYVRVACRVACCTHNDS